MGVVGGRNLSPTGCNNKKPPTSVKKSFKTPAWAGYGMARSWFGWPARKVRKAPGKMGVDGSRGDDGGGASEEQG